MNIVTATEIRKPLTFAAWHLRRYGVPMNKHCGGPRMDCTHFYACYLTSLKALRGKPKKKGGRK